MSDYAVVLAARMGSERLPGKALSVYCPDGMTNLEQICRRWLASDRAPRLIIATPDDSANDPIAAIGEKLRLPVSRRDASLPRNVVNEIDLAIATYAPEAKWVARALADNPLVDMGLADWRLDVLAETGADGLWYGAYHDRITYAGTTDVWSKSAWDLMAKCSSGSQLEHAGSYYWDNIDKFRVVSLNIPRREYLLPVRTELDTPEDLAMLRSLWNETKSMTEACYRWGWAQNVPAFMYLDTLSALRVIEARPRLSAINAAVELKTQSQPCFPSHYNPRYCGHCNTRYGSLINENFRMFCPGCGRHVMHYANKPLTHNRK